MSVNFNTSDADVLATLKKIELGGGTKPLDGFYNIDPVHGDTKQEAQEVPWRLAHGTPVPSDSVEEVYASHVLEHIPAGSPRIAVFNEAWRVLKVGGTFRILVPKFPSWQAIADPTHVSFFVEESFAYFCHKMMDADYGIKYWKAIKYLESEWQIDVTLQKPPPEHDVQPQQR